MAQFQNKVVIVTGGAKGIGRAISLSFAREGANVLCADVDVKAGEQITQDAKDLAGKLVFVNADVSQAANCKKLVDQAVADFGGLDILCNNVGIQPTSSYLPAHEVPEETWDRIINVNLKSRFLMAKYGVPEMKKRGGGVIINTASVQGLQSALGVAPYAASKGGDLSLTRQLALEYAKDNIRVLAINPGQSQRWRILNATNARYLRLALTGHTMTLIGTDGGLLHSPVPGLDEILLAPAERVEVIVTASLSSHASTVLQALPYNRGAVGMMRSSSTTIPLLTLANTSTAMAAVALPSALNTIADLRVPTTTKRLVLSSGMGMGGMGGGMMSFLIDGKTFDPQRIDLTSRVNEVEQWTIENRSSMDHPFHLHGTQFQVVSRTRSGVTTPEPFLAWRDTVNVAAFETVVLKVVQDQLGKRMYHCHILEHESQGMMGVLEVVGG